MGEVAKYYVPDDQERFLGKESEVAEAFWQLGVFLVTPDRFIYDRISQWRAERRPLPDWNHNFTFAEMGLGSSPIFEPVPNSVYDLICPACGSDVSDAAYEEWYRDDMEVPLPSRQVACPTCAKVHLSGALRTRETRFTFARFYLWVADIDTEDWDATFKRTVESVLGPCEEFTAWET